MRKEKVMKKHKNMTKLSNLLLEALRELKTARLRNIQTDLEEFGSKCSEATKNSHQFNTAVGKGWFGSAEKIRTRAGRNMSDFSYHLQRFKDLLNSDETELPKLSCIFAELSQIEEELGEYKFDLKEKTISVITEPISLEGILLGAFEIKLSFNAISKLYTESPYRVMALEPNPAGADSCVTHPHVSSGILCEGDGVVSIRKAIEQGRLCDFFTMIVNILQTYNPDSPYVALDEWEGVSCYGCGYTVAGEDCYYCEDCEHDYCSSCSSYCQICDITVCLGCGFECPDCNQLVCRECLTICSECEESVCENCVNEEKLCKQCEETRKEKSDEEKQKKEESTEPKTSLAVQPDSVGQAAVHA